MKLYWQEREKKCESETFKVPMSAVDYRTDYSGEKDENVIFVKINESEGLLLKANETLKSFVKKSEVEKNSEDGHVEDSFKSKDKEKRLKHVNELITCTHVCVFICDVKRVFQFKERKRGIFFFFAQYIKHFFCNHLNMCNVDFLTLHLVFLFFYFFTFNKIINVPHCNYRRSSSF